MDELEDEFEQWFQAMRRKAWKANRAGYENEPMVEIYLMLLRPYFLEAWKYIPPEKEK